MLNKKLCDKIQASRNDGLLPFVMRLFKLIPSDKGSEAAVVLASITKISDDHAVTRSHFTWTDKMLEFADKFPQHEAMVTELLQYVSDSAAIELVIAGASQKDIDRWEDNVKKLLTTD